MTLLDSLCVQGTNFGLKSHSCSMKPTMNMDNAAQAINTQQDLKVAELEAMILNDYLLTNKLYSNLQTAPHSVSLGEGLMKASHDRSSQYAARRTDRREFQVGYVGSSTNTNSLGEHIDMQFTQAKDDEDISEVPLPLFSRIRTVRIGEDGTMICSCCKFRMTLIYCEHCVCVAKVVHKSVGKEFKSFTRHDVGVRWMSDYMHLAYKKSTPSHIQQMYHMLATSELRGPKLTVTIPDVDVLPIEDREPILPALDRLRNYAKGDIDLELFDSMKTNTYSPESSDSDDMFDLLSDQINTFNAKTSMSYESVFELSVNNSDLPMEMEGSVKTRELLKQKWEEACEMADNLGSDATRELEQCLNRFETYCNIKSSTDMAIDEEVGSADGPAVGVSAASVVSNVDDSNKKRRVVVPMTKGKYTGTQERHFNTHHMYRNG